MSDFIFRMTLYNLKASTVANNKSVLQINQIYLFWPVSYLSQTREDDVQAQHP